jgi:hypothetical protein
MNGKELGDIVETVLSERMKLDIFNSKYEESVRRMA